MKKNKNKKLLIFLKKALISVKDIFWQIFKKIVENPDLYGRKTT